MLQSDEERHKRGSLRLLAIALLPAACSSQHITKTPATTTSTATTTQIPSAKARSSEDVLDGAIKADEPGCSAAVGIEGKVAWTGVRGLANLAAGTPLTADTVFDIASVSKQFTATAILLLVEVGKLTLDDALSRYVPDMPAWSDKISIPDYVDRTTQAEALQALAGAPELVFKPGTRCEYSNSNYLLLGEIVHRVSGQPLPGSRRRNSQQGLVVCQGRPGYQVADSPWEQIGDGGIQTTPTQVVRWAGN